MKISNLPGSLLIILIFIFGCKSGNEPKDLLSPKEITPILVDLHLAESIYTQRYALNLTRENIQDDLYLSVLKKHKVDQKVFEQSLAYYTKYPEKYKPIYDAVVDLLNERDVKNKMNDSIRSRTPKATK